MNYLKGRQTKRKNRERERERERRNEYENDKGERVPNENEG